MKQQKTQNGITLIALIITIIVLLILAVVAIGAVQDSDIIVHAEDAAETYKTKADEENQILQDYVDFISNKTSENVNHGVIEGILAGLFSGTMEESVALQSLKDEGVIDKDEYNLMGALEQNAVGLPDGTIGIYFEKIGYIYKMQETDDGITFSYVAKNEDPLSYKVLKCAKITKEALEDIFLGEKEVKVPANLGTDSTAEREFLDHIVNNSSGRIKSIDRIRFIGSTGNIVLSSLVIVDENGNDIILEYVNEDGETENVLFGYDLGYTIAIKPENGVVTSIEVRAGT